MDKSVKVGKRVLVTAHGGSEVSQMDRMTMKEIIEALKKDGFKITKRTFEYYQKLNLIPKPVDKVKGRGGKGVYGLYYPYTVELIKVIQEFQKNGVQLIDILESGKKEILRKVKNILKEWGFNDITLSELKGYRYNQVFDYEFEKGLAEKFFGKDPKKIELIEILAKKWNP